MLYEVKDIVKNYGELEVLDEVSMKFEMNKITCILGPSGCGKTTLANIIGGLLEKDSGQVVGFQGEDISFVFQEDRLIPWKNVKDNIAFVLKDKMEKKEIEKIVDEYLELVDLEEFKYYYPRQLSGGMRQRISILRAFVYPSTVLIMDEPFKSLDINSKRTAIEFILNLRKLKNKTCILITHDIDEALTLGDSIVILSEKPTKVKAIVKNTPTLGNNKEKDIKLKKFIESQLIKN